MIKRPWPCFRGRLQPQTCNSRRREEEEGGKGWKEGWGYWWRMKQLANKEKTKEFKSSWRKMAEIGCLFFTFSEPAHYFTSGPLLLPSPLCPSLSSSNYQKEYEQNHTLHSFQEQGSKRTGERTSWELSSERWILKCPPKPTPSILAFLIFPPPYLYLLSFLCLFSSPFPPSVLLCSFLPLLVCSRNLLLLLFCRF